MKKQENEVLKDVVEGLNSREIAKKYNLSEQTIYNYQKKFRREAYLELLLKERKEKEFRSLQKKIEKLTLERDLMQELLAKKS